MSALSRVCRWADLCACGSSVHRNRQAGCCPSRACAVGPVLHGAAQTFWPVLRRQAERRVPLTSPALTIPCAFVPAHHTGPLARQPLLRALGWWHSEPLPSTELRAGQLGSSLRHLSLCMQLDQRALELLAGSCPQLEMLQVGARPEPLTDEHTNAEGPMWLPCERARCLLMRGVTRGVRLCNSRQCTAVLAC